MANPTKAQAAGIVAFLSAKLTERAIIGSRFSAHLYAQIAAKIKDLEKKLVGSIASGNITAVTQAAARRARLADLVGSSSEDIFKTYNEIAALTGEQLDALTPIEVKATRTIINAASEDVGFDYAASAPSSAAIGALEDDNIVGGLSIKDLWARQEQGLVQAFTREMRLGSVAGEGIDGLVTRISGLKSTEAPTRGIIQTALSSARSISETSVHATQQNAHVAVTDGNTSLFDILTHLSVLDSKTSLICLSRAGKSWNAVTKEPLPGNPFPFAIPPLHPHCRSIVIPNMSIAGPQTFLDANTFIRGLSEEAAYNLLGPGRAGLFLAGKITINDLIDQTDRPLTLAMLENL